MLEIDLSGKVIWMSNSLPIKLEPVAWLCNVYRHLGHPIEPKTGIFKGSDINQQDSKELFVVPEFIHLGVRAFGGIYGIGKEKSVAIWVNLSEEGRHLPTQCIHNASQHGGSFQLPTLSNIPHNHMNQTQNIFLNCSLILKFGVKICQNW